MNVFPLKLLFILRFALVEPVTEGEDAKTVEVIGNAEDTTDDIVGRRTIVETTTTHLNPS